MWRVCLEQGIKGWEGLNSSSLMKRMFLGSRSGKVEEGRRIVGCSMVDVYSGESSARYVW